MRITFSKASLSIILIILIFWVNPVNSQSNDSILIYKVLDNILSDSSEVIEQTICLRFSDNILVQKHGIESFLFDRTLLKIKEKTQSEQFYLWQKAVKLIDTCGIKDSTSFAKVLNFYCESAIRNNKIKIAKNGFFRVFEFLPKGENDEELGLARNNLATLYDNEGNPGLALAQYKEALEIFENMFGASHAYCGIIKNNIGNSYGDLKRIKDQISNLEESVEILNNSLGRKNARTAESYFNLALAYNSNNQLTEALNTLDVAREIYKDLNNPSGQYKCLFIKAGMMAGHKNIYSTNYVKSQFRNAIDYGISIGDKFSPILRDCYANYAVFLYEQNEFDEALLMILNAFKCQFPDYDLKDTLVIPVIEDQQIQFDLISLLETKGVICRSIYLKTGNMDYLDHSMTCFELTDRLFEYAKSNILNGISRIKLKSQARTIYRIGLSSCILKYAASPSNQLLNRILEYAEKVKAWDLLENYLNKDRLNEILDNEILDSIQMVRSSISNLSFRSKPIIDSTESIQIRLLEKLKRDHPYYFNYLYDYKLPAVQELQSFCSANNKEWLYFISDSRDKLSALIISKDTVILKTNYVGKENELIHKCEQLKIKVQTWRSNEYRKYASELYELIFEPLEEYINSEELIITQDPILYNIPFDILLRDSVQNFLIHSYSITYQHSAGVALLQKFDEKITSSKFFAPEYSENNLIYNHTESENASKYLTGDIQSKKVRSSDVIESLSNYDMIHFSGHSFSHKSNYDSIFLLIKEHYDTLFLNEIISHDASAKLLVLSSCHSASGVSSVEGDIALNYAFNYAGVPNIISSIWASADRESRQIFENFYFYFSDGYNSVDALRLAKLEYLNNAPGPGQHPFFWAGWTYSGHPVIFSKSSFNLATGLFILLILALIFIFFKFFIHQ